MGIPMFRCLSRLPCDRGIPMFRCLSKLPCDMGIPQLVPILFCDSQSAIALAKNPVYHAKTKRIGVRYHFIQECIAVGYISLEKVVSQENVADALTKALPHEALEHCCHLMGIT